MIIRIRHFILIICPVAVTVVYYNRVCTVNISKNVSSSRMVGPLQPSDPSVLENLRENYMQHPSKGPYNFMASRDPSYEKMYRKYYWSFVDYYLKVFHKNTYNGVFFEAGALDGEFISHTLWLEQHRNWTGILVEPDEVSFKHLISKHRKAWASNTCVSKNDYPEQIVLETFRIHESWNAYFWLAKAQTRNLGERNYFKIDKNLELNSTPYYIISQCFPLLSYFLALNISVVDFLSLDTQGGEYDAIQSLLKSALAPYVRIISVEHIVNNTLGSIDKSFINFMERYNFSFVDSDPSSTYIFFNRNDQELNTIFNSENFTLIPAKIFK